MGNERAGAKDLAREIVQDQNISSKIISLSNSPMFMGAKNSVSVEDAISRVGMQEVKEVVVVLGNRAMHALTDPRFETEIQTLSIHAIATGTASKMVAEHIKCEDVDSCFMAGVVHDLGRLILVRILAQAYIDVDDLDKPFLEEVMSKAHNTIGAIAIEKMGFPEDFVQILLKHEKYDQNFDNVSKELAAVVMGNQLAHKFGYGTGLAPMDVEIETTKVYSHTNMNPELIEKIHIAMKRSLEMGNAL
jgi:HD-like signal output (HDOD) protein